MHASFEKMISNAGKEMLEARDKVKKWLDEQGKKSAEITERIKKTPTEALRVMGADILPRAIARILVGTAKIAGKGIDKYLLDEHWRKGMKLGRDTTKEWAKG